MGIGLLSSNLGYKMIPQKISRIFRRLGSGKSDKKKKKRFGVADHSKSTYW